jgi:hypothetical protein
VSEKPVYVYGVIATANAGSMPAGGVEGSAVRVVEDGDVAALVSDLEATTLAAAREVRAHWRVLEHASADTTVLPVRFGTVLAGDDAVRDELLAPNAGRLAALLRDLEGRVQMSVKGTYAEDGLLRGVVAASPAVAALRARIAQMPSDAAYYERIRLGELVAGEVERVRAQDTAFALQMLEAHAVAAHADPATVPDAAFNLAFLVERDALDAFGAAVGALIEEFGERVAVRYVGPLVPYSFAEAQLAAGGA